MHTDYQKKSRIKKTMELDPFKLEKARQILGAPNDTQAIDRALALVIANSDIQRAVSESFGTLPRFEVR